jgi:hypothetical protein
VTISAANGHDVKMMEATIDAIEPIKRPRGSPRKRPEKLHADKAYDAAEKRQGLRQRGIKPRIARRGIESSESRVDPAGSSHERTRGCTGIVG